MQQGMAGGAPPTPPVQGGPVAAAPAAAAAPAIDLLGVPDVAKALGVSDADVLAVIEAGELKAKKIGSTYRITRAALDSYLAN
jgi:excisionase family DNA binding protein